ncbi:MAG: TusE/DsrC/DsvC family sulfur relay protein [Ignavibacteria bacterium]|nr:TusE/DsrC/DsvC family sulfur relay protein [Ignavibacteria bacterium]MBT8382684.1 TusE/DsrC/DsvC family sulfur relay protein [Ignavibacteria bacterium]MBT8391248.1 TusE/DsrC/DsvC family sulfur relay protein [Ignavibacteria bacterium]NNJ51607.1 TusE/DsrC/DsvC family sulfur relay protein [Ignavibacteriaceae bacterium]NNL21302.1 TusE/DsrC/DsvC family sulfur relay protein [Ignavibacteriaceae bacterium]
METVELVGKQFELDDDGHLKNQSDWNEEVAKEFAKLEGIEELNDRHWIVINFMRKVYQEKGDAPSIRRLTKESGVDTKELYALFPKGPAKKAAKIAGLPKPKGCI